MKDAIVIKPALADQVKNAMIHGRVIFFSAPCGFGKTTTAWALLEGKKVYFAAAGEPGFRLPLLRETWDVLLLDQLQNLPEEEQEPLCELIRRSPNRRFFLLSRGTPPGWLIHFQFSGLMLVLDARALLFDRDSTAKLLRLMGGDPTDLEVTAIQRESLGYPLAVSMIGREMANGSPYSPEIDAKVRRELYIHYETAVYRRFDLPIRRFLLEISPFTTFDIELARMVTGDSAVGEVIDWLQRNTSMLQYDGIQRFHFWDIFRNFLQWEMDREYTPEKQRAIFDRGGLYYELNGQSALALECYTKAGDHAKVSDLLIRNAECHPGTGHYEEMERYYRALPEEEILVSPALMQAMCMLCALEMEYEESERWYQALADFAARCERTDAARKQARSRLAWLDIALPQRGVTGLIDTIPKVFRLLSKREIALPPFSVTSMQPSILNGGKDFSAWSPKDDLLYKTIRLPVEKLLGADGVGLPDCAMAESKFEKGEDVTQRMLTLVSRMGEIQRRGTPDIEFAACGLLARNYIAQGRADSARRTLELLRARFEEQNLLRFLPNMDAMLCRVDLHAGNLDRAEGWYREKAPRDPVHLDVLKRYQYVTQAMVELAEGNPDGALMTLTPLENYCVSCSRYIDGVHLDVLSALALYRKKDDRWQQRLSHALDTVSRFQFVRTISVYGGAVLPLLTRLDWDKDPDLLKKILAHTRKQAAMDPLFLQPRQDPGEALTETEKQILRLICADKSNADIARIMDIKVTTVKTHVSHILEKLDVSRRGEARSAAIRLRLIPEDSWMEEKECHL